MFAKNVTLEGNVYRVRVTLSLRELTSDGGISWQYWRRQVIREDRRIQD